MNSSTKELKNMTNLMTYLDDNKECIQSHLYKTFGDSLMEIKNKHVYFKVQYTQVTVSATFDEDGDCHMIGSEEILTSILEPAAHVCCNRNARSTLRVGKIPMKNDDGVCVPHWTIGTMIYGHNRSEQSQRIYNVITSIEKIEI